MESYEVGTAVIGAGVVGLAVAAELARRGREVWILERGARWGAETSSRNSEVIHAGIYNPPESLKTRLCVEGRRRLYAWAEARGVGHRKCGKLILAAEPEEEPALAALAERAAANGVALEPLTGTQAQALAPGLRARAALFSPETGILDSHGFMESLLAEAEAHGAILALRSEARGGAARADGRFDLDLGETRLVAREVVNAAGLGAQALARRIEGRGGEAPPLVVRMGRYFALAGRSPFSRLIYPVPPVGGLGVHLTLDLGGRAKFGPDVGPALQDPEALDYRVDPALGPVFEAAVRRWWPGLPEGALQPDSSGARPKLSAKGEDFRIEGAETHGLPGWIDLFGIESPGLTSALALAELVAEKLEA
ncbi:NAD(P)/FAD-dependent oxidoreductase [Neomegalonema perideroedes]|uniref:NAD(P)/FAD-dependent oxidoreductase n=1 Tax=Neomegalonema perideroedes TaxID=217219 RepID=UPI0003780280|nr:NAD(P)/FAD-dependent oxidoreductase [Neomegalonema perideroedes]